MAHFNAPSWRTADFGDGTARVAWTSALDPGELKAYTIDCSTELVNVDNRIEAVDLTPSGLAVLAGLQLGEITNDRSNITVWLSINPADRSRVNWQGEGERHTLTCRINVTDGQIFERDVTLQIKQLG